MVQATAALIYLDSGHTGGRDVASDIVLPEELATRLRRHGMSGIAALLAGILDGAPPANDDGLAGQGWDDHRDGDWDDLDEEEDAASLRLALAGLPDEGMDAGDMAADDMDTDDLEDDALTGLPWLAGRRRG